MTGVQTCALPIYLIGLIIDAKELPHNPPTTVIDTTTEELTLFRQGRINPLTISNHELYISNSADETIKLGEDFILNRKDRLKSSPTLVLLSGELGVGKTHFTKGIARGLGIDRIIKSPTYNYVNEYKIGDKIRSNNEGKLYQEKLFHMDAWRIQSKKDLELLAFEKWYKPCKVIVGE